MEVDLKATLQKAREGKVISVSNYVSVYFRDMRLICPALDSNPKHSLIVTIPFPGLRSIEGKKGEIHTKADVILMCLTDSEKLEDKFFEATDENFLRKGWLARVPSPDISPRWSMESLSQYLYGNPERVTPADCYKASLEQFNKFLDFGKENTAELCAVYSILSYFYFNFSYVPYLKFGGEKESGKSKAGAVFGNMGFNAKVSLNESTSSLFRFAQDNRGIMIIDEAEQLNFKDEKLQAIYQILNGGFDKNGAITRVNKDTMRPERYNVFCPKVICSILPVMEVLETRTFEVIMLKTNDLGKGNLDVSSDDPVWQPIRDKMYLCLMQHWREVRELDKTVKNDHGFEGRFWNISKPLIAIARWIDNSDSSLKVEDKIVSFLQEQIKSKQSKAVSSLTTSILAACLETIEQTQTLEKNEASDYVFRVPLSQVVDKVRTIEEDHPDAQGKYKISSKRVSGILSNLRLYTDPERSKLGYTFLISQDQLKDVQSRFTNQSKAKAGEHGEHNERVNVKTERAENSERSPDSPLYPKGAE